MKDDEDVTDNFRISCMNNVMFYQKRFAVASFGVLDENLKSRPVSPGQLAPQAPALSEY